MTSPPRNGIAIGAVVFLTIALTSMPSHAGDVGKGRKIATVRCQMCHGLDGQARIPQAPNLSGQVEQYIVEQVQAFKSGARKNDMMTLVVKPLSESDLADVAAYYAAVEVKVVKVPGQ
jgi:cytochrome c553